MTLWNELDATLARWLERFSVAVLGDDGAPLPPTLVGTGNAALDAVLGGGVPRGRTVEIFGGPGSGKTQLALGFARAGQRRGDVALWIDADGAFDPSRAEGQGVDLTRLVVLRPRTGEQGFKALEALTRQRLVQLAVIDSIAALLPHDELTAPVGAAAVGTHARMMSRALRRLHGALADAGCTMVVTNQLRTAFDAVGRAFPVPTGGVALASYAATRLELLGGAQGVIHKRHGGPGGQRISLPERPLELAPRIRASA